MWPVGQAVKTAASHAVNVGSCLLYTSSQRDLFAFEDLAGIYTEKNLSRLFAVCIRYTDMDGLKIVDVYKRQ